MTTPYDKSALTFKAWFRAARARFLVMKTILTAREWEVLAKKYGIEGNRPHTLVELAEHFGLTRARVHQIENVALGKLEAFADEYLDREIARWDVRATHQMIRRILRYVDMINGKPAHMPAEEIRKLRREAGLTQEEAGRRMGYKASSAGQIFAFIEQGLRNLPFPRERLFLRVCKEAKRRRTEGFDAMNPKRGKQ